MILHDERSQGYIIRRKNIETGELKYFKCYGSNGVMCKINDEPKKVNYITFEFTDIASEAAKFTLLTEANLIKKLIKSNIKIPTPYIHEIFVFEMMGSFDVKILAPIHISED